MALEHFGKPMSVNTVANDNSATKRKRQPLTILAFSKTSSCDYLGLCFCPWYGKLHIYDGKCVEYYEVQNLATETLEC